MTNIVRKRILFSHLKGVTSGGSDTCLYLLAKEIDQTKFEPYLIYKNKSTLVSQLEEIGVKLIYIPSKKKRTVERNNLSIKTASTIQIRKNNLNEKIKLIKQLVKRFPDVLKFASIILRNRIDIVHTNHNLNSDRSMIIAAILLRRKVISHNRGLYSPIPFDSIVSKGINKIINMSNYSKNVYTSNGIPSEVCITVYDGVDIDKFKPSASENKEVTIGLVGRLERWKGQHVLIEAAELVLKQYPEVKFQLIGDGIYEPELRKMVDEKKLRDNVEFTGGVSNVQNYINNCSIIVHASIEPEPFGMVVIEAMALAKPVIATNFGGPLEIIDNEKNGYLIPPSNPKVLAALIIKLIENFELRQQIGQNARKKVISKFEVKKYTRQVEEIYNEILK